MCFFFGWQQQQFWNSRHTDPTDTYPAYQAYKPAKQTELIQATHSQRAPLYKKPIAVLRHEDTHALYTDGSYSCGYAGAGVWEARTNTSHSYTFPAPHDVGRAELIAVREAIKLAITWNEVKSVLAAIAD